MGGACGTFAVEEGCIQDFGGTPVRNRPFLRLKKVDGRIILKRNFKKYDGVRGPN
jgi:hypothetical protein